MTKSGFHKGALILLISSLIVKIIGALYRIPLTNIIGINGIALYQMVIPVYIFMLAISTNSIPITLSRGIAYLEDNKANKYVKSAFLYVIFISLIVICVLLIGCKSLARMQKQESLVLCYIILCPIIVVVGIKNVLKGYLLGKHELMYPAISQVVEQVVKISLSLVLTSILIKESVLMGVVGAFIGLLIGEFIEMLFLLIFFFKIRGKNISKTNPNYQDIKSLFLENFPIMTSGLVFPLISFIESFLIVNLLEFFGENSQTSILNYGILQGPVSSMVNLPIVFAISISISIIPYISSLLAKNMVLDIKNNTSSSIKICLICAIPITLMMVVLSKDIFGLLYSKITLSQFKLCIYLFSLSAFNIIGLSLLEVFNSILQGLGFSKIVFRNLAIGFVFKFISEIILIKFLGIYGVILSNLCFYLVSISLCVIKYVKLVGPNFELIKSISKTLLVSVIMAIIILIGAVLIKNMYLRITLLPVIGLLIYIFALLKIKVLDENELLILPLGERIVKICKKFKILR